MSASSYSKLSKKSNKFLTEHEKRDLEFLEKHGHLVERNNQIMHSDLTSEKLAEKRVEKPEFEFEDK